MFRYNYEIFDKFGKFFAGTIRASSDSEAIQRFASDDLVYLARTNTNNSELTEFILVDSDEEYSQIGNC